MIPYHFDTVIAIIIAYLFGSISSAIIVCKLMGLPDPRTEGSKNPGTTNVLRLGGKKAAIITLLGDMLKGVIPVLAAKWYGLDTLGMALVAFAAFFGHLYPIFFRFQGGKGVATAFGCLISLNVYIGISLAITWLVMAYLFRYSSLAAIIASALAPFYAWYFTNWTYTIAIACIATLLICRHHKNIRNLLTGKESKIGSKKS
jgi:acyl phosphate:glycerol-3-phosphate acyltransferase